MHHLLRRAAVAALALMTMATGAATASTPSDTTVHTANGVVRGSVAENYRVFNGIPYAQPPVGPLRWQPPQPAASWTGVRDATQPGPECLQTGSSDSSEDCLNLNVWTPRNATPGAKLPVAVWIYGGAFRSGAAQDYQPVDMVNQGNMIVVTINYRLGAMGQLTLPQLDADNGTASGDYALLDQIKALQWVKSNVTGFGGDPSRVTVAGQSAGGESVCTLLASPSATGLFNAAIVESGLTCVENTLPTAQKNDAAFVTSLGCDNPDPAAVVACLRALPEADILAAQTKAGNVWYPTTGTKALPIQPPTAFATGKFNHVPVLIGNTRNEGASFIYSANDALGHPVTADGYLAALQNTFGDKAPDVLARYPLANYSAPGAAETAIKTDVGFSCATLSNATSLTQAVPTYVYEFRDVTAPHHESVPSSFPIIDPHASELPYLWGTSTTPTLTAQQKQLSSDMIAYWAQFAHNATLKVDGLPSVPRYSASNPHEVAFNSDGPAIVNDMAAEHQCSYWNAFYPNGWPFHFGF